MTVSPGLPQEACRVLTYLLRPPWVTWRKCSLLYPVEIEVWQNDINAVGDEILGL